jgi:hypothetical protein
LCTDGELVRVGFMAPADVKAYAVSPAAAGIERMQRTTNLPPAR